MTKSFLCQDTLTNGQHVLVSHNQTLLEQTLLWGIPPFFSFFYGSLFSAPISLTPNSSAAFSAAPFYPTRFGWCRFLWRPFCSWRFLCARLLLLYRSWTSMAGLWSDPWLMFGTSASLIEGIFCQEIFFKNYKIEHNFDFKDFCKWRYKCAKMLGIGDLTHVPKV